MTRPLPEWLPAALEAHAFQKHVPAGDSPVSAGDVRVGNLGPVRRLILVLDVPDDHAVVVALLSNEFDLATDQDVVVRPSDGLPYPLVIETDVVGALARQQLGGLIRRLPDGLFAEIRRAAIDGEFGPSLDGRRGVPLTVEPDPRRVWKETEGDLFDPHVFGVEQARPCILDAAVLAPDAGIEPRQAQAALLSVLAGECAVGPRGAVAILRLALRAGGGAPWLHDAARSLSNRIVISDTENLTQPLIVSSGPVRLYEPYPLDDLIADLASFASHTVVVTARSAWVGEITGRPIQVPRGRQPPLSVDLVDCSEVTYA
jgi:hypothetical protein